MPYLCLSLYIHAVNLAADGTRGESEEHQAMPIGRPSINAQFGGRCVEPMEFEGRDSSIKTPPHLLRHPMGIGETVRCWFMERRKWVTRYDMTQHRGSHTITLIHDITDRASETASCETLNDMIRWKREDIFQFHGLPNMYYPSLFPPPLPMNIRTFAITPWWCTGTLWSREFGDALGGRNRVSLEIHLDAVIEWTWRT